MNLGKVLVVDDEPEVRRLIQDFLLDRGYEVLLAENGEDALLSLVTNKPDLVLLDIAMPGMEGVEALRRIGAVDPRARVIMITANTDISVTSKVLALGAVDYIPKPFDLDYLEQAVRIQVDASRDD